ncbi:MAG TPA: radical SAM protein [Streptomyces sp.]
MTIAPEAPTTPRIPTFLELEITRRCQLTCPTLCFVQAGPTQGHGVMTAADWKRVISEAAALNVKKIQLIGGEATLHPDFVEFAEHALAKGREVEVYSNLYRVRDVHWALFARPGVTLATSYYADTDEGHDQVTGRTGSHAATRANLLEALRRGIRVRVGIVDVHDGQRVEEARAELEALGITEVHIDRVRGVGNAAKDAWLPSTSELCGRCARGTAAVLSDGTVTPCVLGRFLPAGQVQDAPLEQVFASLQWQQVAASIPAGRNDPCAPDCGPNDDSQGGGGTCGPADDGVIPSPAGRKDFP